MARGRKALPDEIKALKGNPGKRKLILEQGEDKSGPVRAPAYVSTAEEKRLFTRIAEALGKVRFIKATDADALGRYCVYLARWVSIKKRLNGRKADVYYETESRHGKMLRMHPLHAAMMKIETILMAHEDRIGLNPSSRQTILKGLINAPNLPPSGGLFDDDAGAEKPVVTAEDRKAENEVTSPMGFLTAYKH